MKLTHYSYKGGFESFELVKNFLSFILLFCMTTFKIVLYFIIVTKQALKERSLPRR